MRHVSLALATLALLVAGCKSAPKAPLSAETAPPAKAVPATETKVETAAKTEEKSAAAKTECSRKNDKRTLEVRAKDKGCELAYTKNGQEAVVATSRSGSEHCKASSDKIKGKLEAAGFTCN